MPPQPEKGEPSTKTTANNPAAEAQQPAAATDPQGNTTQDPPADEPPTPAEQQTEKLLHRYYAWAQLDVAKAALVSAQRMLEGFEGSSETQMREFRKRLRMMAETIEEMRGRIGEGED